MKHATVILFFLLAGAGARAFDVRETIRCGNGVKIDIFASAGQALPAVQEEFAIISRPGKRSQLLMKEEYEYSGARGVFSFTSKRTSEKWAGCPVLSRENFF